MPQYLAGNDATPPLEINGTLKFASNLYCYTFMTSYQYNVPADIETGKKMTRAEERMKAHGAHANDQMHQLKRKPSMSDHGKRLVRKTSSRLGLVRKNSIGFHNDGTLWEHIVTCKMDCFDCCVMGVCYAVIGFLALGILLAFVISGDGGSQNVGYGILFFWGFYCIVFSVVNQRGGWKS